MEKGDKCNRDGARSAPSLLAPSKFSTNFLSGSASAGNNSSPGSGNAAAKLNSDSGKPSFAGFKASKLSGITQTLFSTETKKDPGSGTTISWTAATTKDEATTTASEKPKPVFLPLEPKSPTSKETDKENGENSVPKISPAKRSPEKVDEDVSSPKRVRLEVVAPQLTHPTTTPTTPTSTVEKSDQLPTIADSKTTSTSSGETESKKSTETVAALSPTRPSSASESSNFIFGENLTERADNFASVKSASFVFGQNLIERAGNFTPEETEAATAPKLTPVSPIPAAPISDPKSPPKSLTESAAAYYESHALPKRKYDEVVVVTGEEGEVNVVQMSAKLHWFDKATGTWHERGRGLLRLNDVAEVNAKTSAPPSSSRLVMRTAGSLRVILNTKLYRGMPVECPTEKNLRLTGMDDSGILKVFLVTGATKDISNMQAALQFRLAAIEKACAKEGHPALSDEDSDENEDDDCGASKIKAPRLA